jgi:hypothetical protein
MSKAKLEVILSAKEVRISNKISKPKTVTHEGQVYQIGESYLFSDNRIDFSLAKLVGIKKNVYPFRADDGDGYRYINEVSALKDMGTITPAPIKLVDGAAYMFSFEDSEGAGLYVEDEHCLYMVGCQYSVENCTNIRPMAVVEGRKL